MLKYLAAPSTPTAPTGPASSFSSLTFRMLSSTSFCRSAGLSIANWFGKVIVRACAWGAQIKVTKTRASQQQLTLSREDEAGLPHLVLQPVDRMFHVRTCFTRDSISP